MKPFSSAPLKIGTPHSNESATVIFVINVDWFFVSHFQHLARRVVADGHTAILASHLGPKSKHLKECGIKLFHLPLTRHGVQPAGLAQSVKLLEDLIKEAANPIVHAFGLTGVLVATLATRRLTKIRRVYTITGRGYTAAAQTVAMRSLNALIALFNRLVADDKNVRWIVENTSDIRATGLRKANKEGRVAVVGGAGVDLDKFTLWPLPSRPPLRIGFVSRLIWSKGLDIAVRAVELARSRGCDVTLTVAGSPDPSNPRAYTDEELEQFASTAGVDFVGYIDDVQEFWRSHHIIFLPSRGGEGLPKCLLEAASCGRAALVSDVPGCADFGVATGGWVINVDNIEAATDVIEEVASSTDLDQRGALARAVVEQDYSEEKVWNAVSNSYFT